MHSPSTVPQWVGCRQRQPGAGVVLVPGSVVVVGAAVVVAQAQVVDVVVGPSDVVVGAAVVVVGAAVDVLAGVHWSVSSVHSFVLADQVHLHRPLHGGGVVVVDVLPAAVVVLVAVEPSPLLMRTTAYTVPVRPIGQRIWHGAEASSVLTSVRPEGLA